MEFRWLVILALWTLLAGPIFQPAAPTIKTFSPQGNTVTASSSAKALP